MGSIVHNLNLDKNVLIHFNLLLSHKPNLLIGLQLNSKNYFKFYYKN